MIQSESTNTTGNRIPQAWAIWITGLPASGKSTLAAALFGELTRRKVHAVVLESDLMRQILTPESLYTKEEREFFTVLW